MTQDARAAEKRASQWVRRLATELRDAIATRSVAGTVGAGLAAAVAVAVACGPTADDSTSGASVSSGEMEGTTSGPSSADASQSSASMGAESSGAAGSSGATASTGGIEPRCDDTGPIDGFSGEGILVDIVDPAQAFLTHQWTVDEGNYVSCAVVDGALEMRFAPSPADEGLSGCHLDIRLCNWGGLPAESGSWVGQAGDQPCGAEQTVAISWHNTIETFHSVEHTDATPCIVSTDPSLDSAIGEIVCSEMLAQGGGMVAIFQGAFLCTPPSG